MRKCSQAVRGRDSAGSLASGHRLDGSTIFAREMWSDCRGWPFYRGAATADWHAHYLEMPYRGHRTVLSRLLGMMTVVRIS